MPALTKYKCNVCGSLNPWHAGMVQIMVPVGTGQNSWEEYFICCSDKCKENCKSHFVEWLASKDGWTKESSENKFELIKL